MPLLPTLGRNWGKRTRLLYTKPSPTSSQQCLWTKRHSRSRRLLLPFSQLCSPARASQVPRASKSSKKLAVRSFLSLVIIRSYKVSKQKMALLIWKSCYTSSALSENISQLPVRALVKRCGPSSMRSWLSTTRTMTVPSMSLVSSAMLSISLEKRCCRLRQMSLGECPHLSHHQDCPVTSGLRARSTAGSVMKKTRCYGTQSGMYTNDQRKSSLLCCERSRRPCYLTVSA